jgi:K+-transporting ATPase A subunit
LIERPIYRITGVDPESEQAWRRYAASLPVAASIPEEPQLAARPHH